MKLVQATTKDAIRLCKLQREVFADLLAKYQDYETNPEMNL